MGANLKPESIRQKGCVAFMPPIKPAFARPVKRPIGSIGPILKYFQKSPIFRPFASHQQSIAPVAPWACRFAPGVDLKDSEVIQIKRTCPNLAAHFIILAEGERPEGNSVFLFLVGIVLSVVLVWDFYKNGLGLKKPVVAGAQPVLGESATPPPLPE
jgi:hypothetical protein